MNIDEISENILTLWGKVKITDSDYPLYKQTVDDMVKNHTAVYIRRDLDRNQRSDVLFRRIEAEVIPVTIGGNLKVLRTKNPIPEPVRLKGDSDFSFVGSLDGLRSFSKCEFQYLNDISDLEITSGKTRYSRKNNYLYLINSSNELEFIAIEAVFLEIINNTLNVDDVRKYNTTYEFPVSRDVIKLVTEYIIKELNTNTTPNP